MKLFKDSDIVKIGHAKRIFTTPNELHYKPLKFHIAGLSKTATGYGTKIETPYILILDNINYRVYSDCYGNAASCYIMTSKHGKIYVD